MRGGMEEHERPRSCGSQRLMTTTDARACRVIILDPGRPGPARPRRGAPGSRSPAPAAYLATIPTHEPPRGGGIRSSPSSRWPPLRSSLMPGPSPRSRSGLRMRRNRSGPRWAPAGMRPTTISVPAEATIRQTLARLDADALTAWPLPSARGWRTGRILGSGDGRSRSTARRCGAPTCWPAGPPAGG
jgi:hypothetical protein